MIWSTDPSKNVSKPTHPKIHDKAVLSDVLGLNLNKINGISFFYNQHINKVTPHFTFMRWAQNADTDALKQRRLSKTNVPCLFQLCTGYRI